MTFALESLARQSLAQYMTIYSEVIAEHGDDMDAQTLERLMWTKITGGPSKTNKVPWALAKKIKIQLPYLPHLINYTGCVGLKKCDGLYVPCGGKCVEGDSILCVTCEKHGAKYGVLDDRGEPGNYTDPTDKREITYGNWLQKHEKTIEDVNAAIQEAGFTFEIPTSYLTVNAKRVAKHKAGRPKSKLEVSEDSESESEEEKPKKLPPVKKTKAKSDDDSDEKPKKLPPVKKAKAESEDEAEPILKPKRAPKKKAESKDDDEELPPIKAESKSDEKPKKKATKPKEESKDEHKKSKPKKEEEKSGDEKSDEEKKKAKPKKKTARKEEVEETGIFPSLGAEVFEPEEDEQVIIDGKEYTLRGKTIFDEDGMFVGTMVDGVPVFRAER